MDERKTYPELPVAAALTGTEELAVWQNGKLVRAPGNTLLDLVRAAAPSDLNTLQEVAAAINNLPDFWQRVLFLTGGTMTGPIVLPGDPASALHAATKQYVDTVAAGLDPKPSATVATTGNITLSGAQTIDGIAVVAGDRVLVRAQTAPAENGVWIVAAGAWTRAADMDSWAEVPGAFVIVERGTAFADTMWVCTADQGGTLGTTAITWSQYGTSKIAFSAHKNGVDQTGVPSATLTKVTFGAEAFDLGGFYNTTTSKWVPAAGKVRVSTTILFSSANMVDTSLMQAQIFKNGVAVAAQATMTSGTQTQGVTATCLLDVNGADEIEVFGYLGGAGDKTISGSALSTYFSGEHI